VLVGWEDFREDVGVIVAGGDVFDSNERVTDHFAEPEEAHGHEAGFFGKFFGVSAVDSLLSPNYVPPHTAAYSHVTY